MINFVKYLGISQAIDKVKGPSCSKIILDIQRFKPGSQMINKAPIFQLVTPYANNQEENIVMGEGIPG